MAKSIIVTGASKGIGKAIIYAFARQGFNVAFCARNADTLEKMAKDLKSKFPDIEILQKSIDMSVKEEVIAFAAYINKSWNNISILVNNAGTFIPGEIHQEPDGALEQMIQTNLYSAYYMTKRVLPSMLQQKAGHIFNISSVAGIKAYPNGGSYGISKFAMQGFTKSLREELKEKGIRVTAIIPGATYTASWEGVELPEKRFMKAGDIAQSVWDVYNLSERTVVEEIVLRPQLGDV